MKRYSAVLIWLSSLVACAALTRLAFSHADVAIAAYCTGNVRHLQVLGAGLGSAVVVSGEALVIIVLVLLRLVRGKLPPFAEALALACLTSICAYAVNNSVLKVYFGVAPPYQVLNGTPHTINTAKGSWDSSFPSGHMVLAGAFAGAIMRLYPATVLLLSACLAAGLALLIVGDWHFLSDVIAGTFEGVTAGLLAGELWKVHCESRPR
jgi:membrane-associated phospholipid phosphatase